MGWLLAGIASLPVLGGTPSILIPGVRAQSTDATTGPQLIPRSKEEREQLYRSQHRIFLNVSVTDSSGKPVEGLKQQDFTLLDTGQPRQIVGFRAVDEPDAGSPAHAIVVVDEINSQYAIARVRKELEKFFSETSAPLSIPTTLAVLSDSGVTMGSPSTDRHVIAGQLAEMTKHIKGLDCDAPQVGSDLESRMNGTPPAHTAGAGRDDCNDQKFNFSLNLLDKLAEDPQNAQGRGFLIWIGPGWPVPAAASSGQIMASGLHGNYGNAAAELMTDLRQADVTLDAVSWTEFKRAKGVHQAEESGSGAAISTASLALPVLVRDTGGQAIEKSKNLPDAINACLADAGRSYVLAFDSASSASPGSLHPIEVKVDKPGTTVRTTTAYYAQP